jgi:RNA polymerase sigma factor (sigma-70 family)
MKAVLAVLVYGYWPNLVSRAALKLPRSDAEDVAGEAVTSAIAAAFDGRSVGEFRSWLHTILSRRIADYHEARKRLVPTSALASEHRGEDETWSEEPEVAFEGDALFAQQCLRRAYADLDDERHRLVIDLHLLGPQSALETAKLVDGMSEANVHQIASRFQRRFRELLDDGNASKGDR